MKLEYVEYADNQLYIKLPKGVRPNKTRHFFQGRLQRRVPASKVLLAVLADISEDEAAQRIKVFLQTRSSTWAGVTFAVIRQGPCSIGDDGTELLTSSTNSITGERNLNWQIIFRLGTKYVEVGLGGGFADLSSFEEMGQEVVNSIRIMDGGSRGEFEGMGQSAPKTRTPSVKPGAMRAKDKKRLAKTMESLPDDLQYLRDPIRTIADEDQDMLGIGEVDTDVLAKAIEQQAASRPTGFATAHAEELAAWLSNQTSSDMPWAAPVHFVQAFLMGFDLFGHEPGEEEP